MSVSRTTQLLAVAASLCLASSAWAEDLAATVAGKLRDSGALAGYRVNVKSRSGTIWLEGSVADDRQLAAAVGIAEATPGVERVVNRLVIDGGRSRQAATGGFGLPASTWQLAGVEQPAPAVPAEPPKQSVSNPFAAVAGLLFAGGSQAAGVDERVQLTQATQPAGRMPQRATAGARPMRPQGRPAAMPRTAMQTGGHMGGPMTLPAPGGYDGPLVDGQMVPGTMQYSDGGYPAGDYAVDGGMAGGGMAGGPGMGGMPGPMPMGGTGVGMPPVPMRADGPNMPNYAWPSYAAYPNYAGLQ